METKLKADDQFWFNRFKQKLYSAAIDAGIECEKNKLNQETKFVGFTISYQQQFKMEEMRSDIFPQQFLDHRILKINRIHHDQYMAIFFLEPKFLISILEPTMDKTYRYFIDVVFEQRVQINQFRKKSSSLLLGQHSFINNKHSFMNNKKSNCWQGDFQ